VLIITCPCALALSYPFALGNSIRILGKQGFFLKNTHVIEKMSGITDVVFDKTGTLTKSGEAGIGYEGVHPGKEHTNALYSLFAQSSHPLSRMLYKHLSHGEKIPVTGFRELPGKGITGVIDGQAYQVGSASFTGFENAQEVTSRQTRVHWNYNGVHMGYFTIANIYRDGIENVTQGSCKQL
jgi:P-type Cu+ transporter